MSVPPPENRRRPLIVFPLVVLLLATGSAVAIQYWPDRETSRQTLNMGFYLTSMLAGLLLAGWLLFARPVRRGIALLLIFTPLALFFTAVGTKVIQFDGDMGILWCNPWHNQANAIEAHRRTQNLDTSGKVDLSIVKMFDCPAYRGDDRSGVIPGPALSTDWNTKPPRELWRIPVGGGYAGMVLVNGYLVTLEQRGKEETVACYDADTGVERWKYSYSADFQESLGGPGPRATPTIHDGHVYSVGAKGDFVCLDGSDGKLIWKTNILENNRNLIWAMSGSPLVDGDRVIVTPGVQTSTAKGRGVIAYDRLTGKEVWASGNSQAGYSSPMSVELGGVRQILLFDGEGLTGMQPSDGKELWRFPWATNQGINVAQPVIVSPTEVYISSGYGVGGALIEIKQNAGEWKATQKWRGKISSMQCKFTSPVRWKDCLLGLNNGIIEAVDLADGHSLWRDDRRPRKGQAYGHGQILLSGDLLLVLTEFGEIVLVQADRDELLERGRLLALPGIKTWNNPLLVDGRFYVRNQDEMVCYDLRP